MPEQLLHGADVVAVLEQVRREEGVAGGRYLHSRRQGPPSSLSCNELSLNPTLRQRRARATFRSQRCFRLSPVRPPNPVNLGFQRRRSVLPENSFEASRYLEHLRIGHPVNDACY